MLALLTGCTGAVGGPLGDDPRSYDAAAWSALGNDAEARGGGDASDGGLVVVAGDDGVSPASVCPDGGQGSLAAGLHIREIALYQTVKIPIYQEGAWLTERVAPVVQGKKSLVRVFIDTMPGYVRRDEVRGVLALHDSGRTTLLAAQSLVGGSSTDADVSTTFNFQVAPELVGPDTELSVWLEEPSCALAGGAALDVRVPQAGSLRLAPVAIGPLEVVIVPVLIDGRVPVVNAAELDRMKQALLASYPVPDVVLSVHAPLTWSHTLDREGGDSWSDLLNRIEQQRRADGVPANVYYFGLAQPAVTSEAYCFDGCALGLAPQNIHALPDYQTALGVSFGNHQTYVTMVHELGHAHGRAHAPCAPGGTRIDHIDEDYPDLKAATGSWGWDSRSRQLELEPPSTKDVMGYCTPTWMGLYTYTGIATRSAQVNRAQARTDKSVYSSTYDPWQRVLLYADQSARWGGPVAAPAPAEAQLEPALALDSAGRIVAHIDVVRTRLSEGADAFLNIPTPPADWAVLQLADRKLVLATIAQAL